MLGLIFDYICSGLMENKHFQKIIIHVVVCTVINIFAIETSEIIFNFMDYLCSGKSGVYFCYRFWILVHVCSVQSKIISLIMIMNGKCYYHTDSICLHEMILRNFNGISNNIH